MLSTEISTESRLKKRFANYKPEEVAKLKLKLLGYNNEEEWETLMNNIYKSIHDSIDDLKGSSFFLYYNDVFFDTVFLIQMLKALDDLEQTLEENLDQLDMIYKAASALVEMILREEDLSDEELRKYNV